jgi:non-heme chloroperoxidase
MPSEPSVRRPKQSSIQKQKVTTMSINTANTFTTTDGTVLFYKDYGPKDGPVITFSHGWPLSADAWDPQIFFFASRGYRVIAHDRRGHGRSSQPWDGNHMDQYADDLAELFVHLDVKDAVMVGHSTGGGEVTRYIGRHGTARVKKAVLMGAVPPIMVKTDKNPGGLPLEVFDGFRGAYLADRAQFFLNVASGPFFGFNRPGAQVSQGLVQSWYAQGMQSGFKNAYDCIKAFSETDFTEDLKAMSVPTLVIHGDDDQIVPIGASAHESIKLLPNGTLKIYEGGDHSLADTHKDRFNADVLAFAQA